MPPELLPSPGGVVGPVGSGGVVVVVVVTGGVVVVGFGVVGFGVVGRGVVGFGVVGSWVVGSAGSSSVAVAPFVVFVVVVVVVVDVVVDDVVLDDVVVTDVLVSSDVVSGTSMDSPGPPGCASPVCPPASIATVANAVDTTTPATPRARYGVRRRLLPPSAGGASSIRSSGPSIPEPLSPSLRDRSVTSGSASQRGNLAALPNATSNEQETHVLWLTNKSG